LSATYERPTFAEPGFVIRNVNRVIAQQGHLAAFATFEPDDPDPRGRKNFFTCYAVDEGHGITWADVPTTTYIAQL
jgi:tryptophan-rich sensory protein